MPHPLTPCPARRRALPRLAIALILATGGSTVASAQAATGTIDGVARSADDSAAIPFALVRLLTADSAGASGAPLRQITTNANGRFHLADVAPGRYRLQLARIGYRPFVSPAIEVHAGETLHEVLRGQTRVVELAAMEVQGEPSCLTADRLASEPRLATLWDEVRKGVETRRGFERQYRFIRIRRQDITIERRIGRTGHETRVDTLANDPDSADVRDARRLAVNREKGYAEGGRLTIPDEKELLTDDFLRTHCVESRIEEEAGAYGLRFRPVTPREKGVDVRGTLWVETSTWQVRRLEVEYVRGTSGYASGRIEYGDQRIASSSLRLPQRGSGEMSPGGVAGLLVKHARVDLTIDYQKIVSSAVER